jgi:hypothetical protein
MKILTQISLPYMLGGMIYLNIYFRFLDTKYGDEDWMLIYYLLLNILWIDFMRVSSTKIMKEVKEEMKQNSKLGN